MYTHTHIYIYTYIQGILADGARKKWKVALYSRIRQPQCVSSISTSCFNCVGAWSCCGVCMCVAVCCSVLQYVAVCCWNVLQWVAVCHSREALILCENTHNIHTHTQHKQTHTNTNKNTHTHTCAHTRTHTQTHSHTAHTAHTKGAKPRSEVRARQARSYRCWWGNPKDGGRIAWVSWWYTLTNESRWYQKMQDKLSEYVDDIHKQISHVRVRHARDCGCRWEVPENGEQLA